MILQALNELYERLADDPSYDLPRPGYSTQKVAFCVVLNPDGTLLEIQDARDEKRVMQRNGMERVSHVAKQLALPGGAKATGKVTEKSIGKKAGLLWNDSGYMLGLEISKDGTVKQSSSKLKAFHANHELVKAEIDDVGFGALCSFLGGETAKTLKLTKAQEEFVAAFGVFKLAGDLEYIHQRKKVKQWLEHRRATKAAGRSGMCLITGKVDSIARLHEPKIKNVASPKPPPGGGALLVAFDKDAFRSYGKEQGSNAPVSETAVFAYTNALNTMLGGPKAHRHRVVIGDATAVFWTEKPTEAESLFADFIQGNQLEDNETEASQDESRLTRLRTFMEILKQGGGAEMNKLGDDPDTKFFILGLSPNASRLSVRFWHAATLGQMVDKLKAHYDALRLKRSSDKDPEFPAVWQILDQTAPRRQGKVDREKIPPLLSGPLMRSILTGSRYPQGLFNAVLNRIRADHEITFLRAAIFKAFLTRNHQLDIPMSLDITRTEPAYLLGRLFAVLERTQEDALGRDLNSTIRDRFYSAASATPGTVFPRLLRTYQHHLSKAASEKGQGYKVNREKLVQEIHDKLSNMPKHLILEGQGLFAIGYYHQRQDFYPKKKDTEPAQG